MKNSKTTVVWPLGGSMEEPWDILTPDTAAARKKTLRNAEKHHGQKLALTEVPDESSDDPAAFDLVLVAVETTTPEEHAEKRAEAKAEAKRETARAKKAPKPHTACGCGCGVLGAGRFRPGHDAKLHGRVRCLVLGRPLPSGLSAEETLAAQAAFEEHEDGLLPLAGSFAAPAPAKQPRTKAEAEAGRRSAKLKKATAP